MDQSDPSAVVLAHVQAFNEGDLGALLDGLADDASGPPAVPPSEAGRSWLNSSRAP